MIGPVDPLLDREKALENGLRVGGVTELGHFWCSSRNATMDE